MGKYIGSSTKLRKATHPFLEKEMVVPDDYEFFKLAPEGKLQKAQKWLKKFGDGNNGKKVLEAFAGTGILSMIYLEADYDTIAIEKETGIAKALKQNIARYSPGRRKSQCFHAENMTILPEIRSHSPDIHIIDLDSYSNCIPQTAEAARILKEGYLFISSGEIYQVCRFKRYGFIKEKYRIGFDGSWRDFPEAVLYKTVKKIFLKQGKKTKLVDMFVWPTICRLCIKVDTV